MTRYLTKIQILTIVAYIGYAIWEYYVQQWATKLPPSDPVIRADLIFIYPVLAILTGISIYQFIKRKND